MIGNPYPETLTDECSGIEFKNDKHLTWNEGYEYCYHHINEYYRGIEEGDACSDCGGTGIKTYGSTATWHGGIGGQMMTSGICDRCWGSGSKSKPWLNLRVLTNILTKEQKEKLYSMMYNNEATEKPYEN